MKITSALFVLLLKYPSLVRIRMNGILITGVRYWLLSKTSFSGNIEPTNCCFFTIGALNSTANTFYLQGEIKANFISCIFYSQNTEVRAAYKTCPLFFPHSKNYQSCSANFEVSVMAEDQNGQRLLFSAMNKTAKTYYWTITGFGDPIHGASDTISAYYSGTPNSEFLTFLPLVRLQTTENDGCTDSLLQRITMWAVSNTYVGIKEQTSNNINLTISPNPTSSAFLIDITSNAVQPKRITVSNMLSQIIAEFSFTQSGQLFDITALPSGIYYVRIETNSGTKALKIVKE